MRHRARLYAQSAIAKSQWLALPIALLAIVAVAVNAVFTARQRGELGRAARRGVEAHDALCSRRIRLGDQLAASEKFLNEIKQGKREPIPGITPQDIQFGINRQKAERDDLKSVKCSRPVKKGAAP